MKLGRDLGLKAGVLPPSSCVTPESQLESQVPLLEDGIHDWTRPAGVLHGGRRARTAAPGPRKHSRVQGSRPQWQLPWCARHKLCQYTGMDLSGRARSLYNFELYKLSIILILIYRD